MTALMVKEIGRIEELRKDIAVITGLRNCTNGQLIDISDDLKAMVVGIVKGDAHAFLLGNIADAKIGMAVESRMEPFCIPAGENYIGRIVNVIGEPIDLKGPVKSSARIPAFNRAPSILERQPVSEAFETGVFCIDAMIPIGRGQRELIVGDRMTGKTTICTDTILNQKGKDVICIYCCIGRARSSLAKVINLLSAGGAMEHTIVIAATASSSSGEQYLAPYAAASLGEYFRDRGKHVFVAFDDLTKHAWAYRQLSLLMERAPGREAYPGDVFYLHSQLMERSARLSDDLGGGSMTFFPVVDTLQGDIAGFIPSNLVSMTDGQIYVSADLFAAGYKPAIDLGLSVSRIGSRVQTGAVKRLSSKLKLEYLQYRELLKVTKFKSPSGEAAMKLLNRGKVMTQLLFEQAGGAPYSYAKKALLLYSLENDVLNGLDPSGNSDFKNNIARFFSGSYPDAHERLNAGSEIDESMEKSIKECFDAFFKENSRAKAPAGETAFHGKQILPS